VAVIFSPGGLPKSSRTGSKYDVELTDADLLARVFVDGDQHAFGELVRRHQSLVRGLLRQLTRSDLELADDLAQETFIRAYKHIRSFRGEAKFSTWLYRIAYNLFREEARKRKELVGIDEAQLQAEADPQSVDPGLRHDLMSALANLPLHERTAVVLCCQNGLSHDEASRVLDIPLGTVKTNVLRGREKLKKMLSAWAPS
jgi:RNA polymerase sigma factor (sigma-70 family)